MAFENRRFGPYMDRVYDTLPYRRTHDNGLKSVATICVEPMALIGH